MAPTYKKYVYPHNTYISTTLRQQLVNGMHTTLAFMTLRMHELPEGDDEPKDELMLLRPNDAPLELQDEITYHTLARIACLLVSQVKFYK